MFFRRPDSSSISSLPAVSRLRPLCYADVAFAPACPTSLPACQARSAAGNMQEARVEHGTELTARHGFDPSPAAPHSARSSVANVLGEADDAGSTVTDPPATSLVAASQAHHHIESSDTGRAYGWGALHIGRFDCCEQRHSSAARGDGRPQLIGAPRLSGPGKLFYGRLSRGSANPLGLPTSARQGRAGSESSLAGVQPDLRDAERRAWTAGARAAAEANRLAQARVRGDGGSTTDAAAASDSSAAQQGAAAALSRARHARSQGSDVMRAFTSLPTMVHRASSFGRRRRATAYVGDHATAPAPAVASSSSSDLETPSSPSSHLAKTAAPVVAARVTAAVAPVVATRVVVARAMVVAATEPVTAARVTAEAAHQPPLSAAASPGPLVETAPCCPVPQSGTAAAEMSRDQR